VRSTRGQRQSSAR